MYGDYGDCEYFCDYCGDCVICYWEDPCYYSYSGKHYSWAYDMNDLEYREVTDF